MTTPNAEGTSAARRYHLRRAEQVTATPAWPQASSGLRRAELVGADSGSVHMGLGLVELEQGGHIDTHVHSHEESFFVLDGEPTVIADGRAHRLRAGACGVLAVGVEHAWRAEGPARWIDMRAPAPRATGQPADTFLLAPPPARTASDLDFRDPRSRNFFVLADSDMDVDALKSGAKVADPTVSASMASAALLYSGITVKMLVDKRLDAQLHTMFMVDYQPGAVAHPHDHPFEEAYFMLEGEVDVVADGERFTLYPGDVFWTGVGCVHAFYETRGGRARWLETSAPAPPDRHSYRFERDWKYLAERTAAGGEADR